MSQRSANAVRSAVLGRVSSHSLVLGGCLVSFTAWIVGALLSTQSLRSSLPLVALQTVLAALSFAVLTRRSAGAMGPNVVGILALHCLMYYGLANVMPALFAQRRPPELELIIRVPTSPTPYYSLSTLSAVLFLLGVSVGAALPWKVLFSRAQPRPLEGGRRWPWLPDYRVSVWSCVVLLAVVIVATWEFGLRFDATMLVEGVTATFTPFQLLLWGGIFYFLPIAPLLAASAVVQAHGRRERRSAVWLLAFAMGLSLVVLMVWRMRSTAMIAVLLPIALLVHVGILPLRRTLLPGAVAMVLIYTTVTFIRLSQVADVLAQNTGGTVGISDLLGVLSQERETGVVDRAMFDLSYRAAGLEGVAAILHAEDERRTPLLMGRSTIAGFVQALPGPLRQQVGIPERIKTAPAYLGIFGESDWVTTFLAELTLDFGPFALVVPVVLVGFLFGLADCVLFLLGNQSPALQGFLVLRIPWLLTFVLMGSSAADLLAFFFKANIGYTVLLVLVSATATATSQATTRASAWRDMRRQARTVPVPGFDRGS